MLLVLALHPTVEADGGTCTPLLYHYLRRHFTVPLHRISFVPACTRPGQALRHGISFRHQRKIIATEGGRNTFTSCHFCTLPHLPPPHLPPLPPPAWTVDNQWFGIYGHGRLKEGKVGATTQLRFPTVPLPPIQAGSALGVTATRGRRRLAAQRSRAHNGRLAATGRAGSCPFFFTSASGVCTGGSLT